MPSRRRPPGPADPDAKDASARGEEAPRWIAWADEEPVRPVGRAPRAPSNEESVPPSGTPQHRQPAERPGTRAVGLAAAFVVVGASLGGSVFMGLEHRAFAREQHRTAEFAAAAREGVTALMSVDANHAREDIQRALDDSTGELREELLHTGVALAEKVEASKVSTTVIVDAVAVESTTEDSGIVLVAARSDKAFPDDAERPMNSLRIVVHLRRDDDRLKMAKVDFLQ